MYFLPHILQFSPVLVLIWSNHHKCCSIYMYFLVTYITVQSYPSFDLVHITSVVPFTCISWPYVLQFSPVLVLIWSNHHKCCFIYMYFLVTYITVQSYPSFDLVQSPQGCSIYMYFLATCITVQFYPSFDLVQSPQVLFHLHVFPGHMYYSSVLS